MPELLLWACAERSRPIAHRRRPPLNFFLYPNKRLLFVILASFARVHHQSFRACTALRGGGGDKKRAQKNENKTKRSIQPAGRSDARSLTHSLMYVRIRIVRR